MLFVAIFLLAACENTVFEHPPAASSCDPQLVGRWLSQAEKPEDNGEIVLDIDSKCLLVLEEHEQGRTTRSAPTPLGSARIGSRRYAWLDADSDLVSEDNGEVEPGDREPSTAEASGIGLPANGIVRPGDVVIFAYRVKTRTLYLWQSDSRALARSAIERDIDADVLQRNRSLTVRVRGDQAAIARLVQRSRTWERKSFASFIRDEPVEQP